MFNWVKRLGFAIILGAATPLAAAQIDPTEAQSLPFEPLTIDLHDSVLEYQVEVADTAEETATGMMFRESLESDKGMLFVFLTERDPRMWMKNTLISLDMLFLDSKGEVVAIARNAVPGSLRQISAGRRVKGVLELGGGQAAERGIETGDIVRHEVFGNVLVEASLP